MCAVLKERIAPQAVFAGERAHDLWPEISPLFREHWEEVSMFKDIPLDPCVKTYEAIEESGMLRVYTARIDGVLIGYVAVILHFSIHSQNSFQARGDVVFISKQYRGGNVCSMMLDYVEKSLKDDGVYLAHFHVNPDHPAFGRILASRGYARSEIVYARRL